MRHERESLETWVALTPSPRSLAAEDRVDTLEQLAAEAAQRPPGLRPRQPATNLRVAQRDRQPHHGALALAARGQRPRTHERRGAARSRSTRPATGSCTETWSSSRHQSSADATDAL